MYKVYFEDVKVGDEIPSFVKQTDFMHWNRYAAVNDEFIDLLLESAECFAAADYVDMMAALTEQFARRSADASPILKPYLVHLADAMRSWTAVLA